MMILAALIFAVFIGCLCYLAAKSQMPQAPMWERRPEARKSLDRWA